MAELATVSATIATPTVETHTVYEEVDPWPSRLPQPMSGRARATTDFASISCRQLDCAESTISQFKNFLRLEAFTSVFTTESLDVFFLFPLQAQRIVDES